MQCRIYLAPGLLLVIVLTWRSPSPSQPSRRRSMWVYCLDFFADESAISAVEYAGLLALIGAGIMGAILGLGDAISDDYTQAASTIAG